MATKTASGRQSRRSTALKKKALAKKKTAAKKKAAPKKRAEPVETVTKPHKKGGAPVGNQFWRQRSSHGRKPIFANPVQLWEACVEYFAWVDANPLREEKLFQYQGELVRGGVTKMRAMTIGGLCIFLDISQETWRDYRSKNDFSGVCEQAEEIIREQKFTGAAADLLNPSIIARDLGLREGVDLNATVGVKKAEEMSDDELANIATAGSARTAHKKKGSH